MKCVRIRIEGRVQGVWFRASTRRIARELALTGWVRNEPDGTVLAEATGPSGNIEKFIDWCHHGPELAKVREVTVEEIDVSARGFNDFEIR
jgi:acylphosphatase